MSADSAAFTGEDVFSHFLFLARNQGPPLSFSFPDGDPLPPATLSETRARNALPHPRSGLNFFLKTDETPPKADLERLVMRGVY